MAGLTNERRERLLRDLADLGAGQAESESPNLTGQNFYPLVDHARALEPEVVLIVGDRGAGKSQLFGALTRPELLKAILRRFPTVRLPSPETDRVHWLTAYPLHSDGPDDHGWRRFVKARGSDHGDIERLWFAYLVRVLKPHLDEEARAAVAPLLGAAGGDAEACHAALSECATPALLALDRLDQRLQDTDAWIFIAYDELDTLVRSDWIAMGALIRGLVAHWTSYARRWRRLRAKIFLRTDLFRRGAEIVGADLSKLAANRAELTWGDRELYAMLVKRILNRSEELADYCHPVLSAKIDNDPELKRMPKFTTAEDARPFIERLAGKHMGANRQKGHTFSWILDHIRDGNGRTTPRSLVRLIEHAARRESDHKRAVGQQLLDHTSIRNAVDDVSRSHVTETETHELPWLHGVRERVKEQALVPWQRRDLERLLSADWNGSWGSSGEVRPPARDARELVDYLLELGIVRGHASRESEPQRINVPDLFLAGLGLGRKGGVSRG